VSAPVTRAVFWIAPAVVLVAAAAIVVAGFFLPLHSAYRGWEGDHVDVVLETGLDAGSLLRRLQEAGVIRNAGRLRLWLHLSGRSDTLHAGEYRFEEAATPLEVLDRLHRGDVLLHSVTIAEGLVLEEIARRYADDGFGPAEELIGAFRNPEQIREIDSEATNLEGYLFPDTYRFSRETSPGQIAAAMVRRFREVTGPDYTSAAAKLGLTLREAVTLASLIEKETSLAEERGRISRVFLNRLALGMPLQCDPTVFYALRRKGVKVDALTYGDLETDSPWNTYLVRGLPPGPIANPGEGSLRAAVDPEDGDELYFVASPGGGHRFSKNLRSHQQAVREWRAYLRSSR
jgi:UPF0755 protein